MTRRARPSHLSIAGFSSLSMAAHLACAGQVADASPAQAGLAGVRVDVVAVMPAAVALLRRARGDDDTFFFRRNDARFRGNQHEAQIVPQGIEYGAYVFSFGVDFDFGLQRGADRAGGALRLHLL